MVPSAHAKLLLGLGRGRVSPEEGFECPEVPGLGDFLEAADADNDNRLNSDEFNSAFEEAQDEITPDGQLDRDELAKYVCAKQKAKAAAAQPTQ